MTTAALGIGLVTFATLISALGPIYMKKGAKRFNLKKPTEILKNTGVMLGCLFFGISAILFVIGLKFGELSVLYPLTSMSYVWACFLSTKMLGEKMNKTKWAGIALIIAGVMLISAGRI